MNRRYIISDLHLGHENIIYYCDRPFDSLEEMNSEIVRRWNETVDEDDSVLYLGDVTHGGSQKTAGGWLRELNGNLLVVRGNHDGGLSHNTHVNVVDSCTISHGKYKFYCEHRPEKFAGWQLHGHTHNNNMDEYPFIHHGKRTVNVSAELLGYRPRPLDAIIDMLGDNRNYQRYRDGKR